MPMRFARLHDTILARSERIALGLDSLRTLAPEIHCSKSIPFGTSACPDHFSLCFVAGLAKNVHIALYTLDDIWVVRCKKLGSSCQRALEAQLGFRELSLRFEDGSKP